VIAENPVWPASGRQCGFIGVDESGQRARLPDGGDQVKVERQVETAEIGAVIGHQSVDRQVGFADHHPIGIIVGDAPHLGYG
jgi:hypothetical protein